MLQQDAVLSTSITASLNVRGWSHLDAILLASLATQAPLLLIGPHGTAKSILVNRLAAALGLSRRHYNAALINYDDLVGIPMPDDTGKQLDFIKTPGTIWDVGFVFFDEISRCRPDLQNKLFPIIHERSIVGIHLDHLQHRWAAMNPPAGDDPAGSTPNYYLGSEPLDPALTDRFPFILPVPNWGEMSKQDRYRLIAWDEDEPDFEHLPINLSDMVQQCARRIPELEAQFGEWLGDYIVYLMDLLEQAGLPQSPRRARMLARSVVAVHAARMVLHGDDADPETSAELALVYGIPQNATETPPTQVKLVSLHRQAWEIMEYMDDESWRQVMEELDKARRVALADQLGFSDADLSRLITQTLSAEDSDARQIGLAAAMFLAFKETRSLDASAYEPLSQLAYHVLEPRLLFYSALTTSPEAVTWREIKAWIENQVGCEDSLRFRLQRNYLIQGFPHLWRAHNWHEALEQFTNDLLLFGIEEAKAQ